MWAASASTATRAVLVLDTAEDEGCIGAAKAEAVAHHGVQRLFAAFAQDGQVAGVRVEGFDVCRGGQELVLQHQALENEFLNLKLEEATLSDNTRIEAIAKQLGMQRATSEQEVVILE